MRFIALLALLFVGTGIASAHVSVKPTKVETAAFQLFSVSVPNEKDMPTTAIRLVIPSGLTFVTPTVKAGWTISVKRTGEAEDAPVSEINWVSGTIPATMRDDFTFSAKVPADATTVQWKAYQTYSDGTIVAWDQAPVDEHDDAAGEEVKPYSETQVVDSLTVDSTDTTARNTAIAAFLVALAALVVSARKR